MENKFNWAKEFPSAITVCDKEGFILYMNEKSCKTFEKYGGEKLLGTNLFSCHSETSCSKLKIILKEGKSNSYTIEKDGLKKLIHQSPWFEKGKYMGVVELSIELPIDMPHFVRK